METGVMSRQLNGTPVASGVVNRLDSVMMILWALPLSPLTSRKPSAPAPPDLLTTTIGCAVSLFFAATPWMKRAIWSAPPPVPAGTTNSIGLLGSQADAATLAQAAATASRPVRRAFKERDVFMLCLLRSEERRVGKECRSRWS